MVSPPQEKRIAIPEDWEIITKTVQLTDGRMEWRKVLCETNMTRATLMDIQRALQRAGHDPGPIDGIYGPLTRAAVRSYQQARVFRPAV
jgi:peptidoglycan hydrolase-like protein with peptidoglycan-binding domain